jgi:hypothetical protein
MATYYPQPTYDYPTPKLRSGPEQLLMKPMGADVSQSIDQLKAAAGNAATTVQGWDNSLKSAASSQGPAPVTGIPSSGATQSSLRAVDNTPTMQAGINSAVTQGFDPNAKSMGPPGYLRPGIMAGTSADPAAEGAGNPVPGVQAPVASTAPGGGPAPSVQAPSQDRRGPTINVIDGAQTDQRQAFFDAANLRNAAAQQTYSPRWGYKGNDDAVKAAMVPIQNRQRLSEISLKNAGEKSIAEGHDNTLARGQDIGLQAAGLRDATDRRGQDVGAATAAAAQDVARYGHDVQKYGYDANAKTAAATARADQMNKDRTHNLELQKFGSQQEKQAVDLRETSRKAVESQVGSFVPAGPDGKPDPNAHAAAMSTLNNHIAQRQDALTRQIAKGGPNAAGAAKELAAIEKDPFGALDQKEIRKLVIGSNVAGTIRETGTSGWNPVGTSAANTSAPVTNLRQLNPVIGTDYEATHADGSVSKIPGRYLRQNGQVNQDLNILLQK